MRLEIVLSLVINFCVSLSSKCIIRPTQGRAGVAVVAEEELKGLAV